MKRFILFFIALLVSCNAIAGAIPNLPVAISNNAVVALDTENGTHLFSFTGLQQGKTWQDVTNKAWWLPPNNKHWQVLPPVPGESGRLAAVAVAANESIWLFGGYTVAADGSERSTPETFQVNVNHEPIYQRKQDMPIPVDDMVALVYQDRYIYLISGWHDVGNVNLVQVYDTHNDLWQQATPWPGEPVFGHAGGLVDNQLLVCGGVGIQYPTTGRRSFELADACWQGRINSEDTRRIEWHPAPAMPTSGRYRAAAAGIKVNKKDHKEGNKGNNGRVVFIGGSNNAYNYDGIGYNEIPSEPISSIISYDFNSQQWNCHAKAQTPSMDHRGLVLLPNQSSLRVGGMLANQQVNDQVLQQTISKPIQCPK